MSFHTATCFDEPIEKACSTFTPSHTPWPYSRSDIESIDTAEDDTEEPPEATEHIMRTYNTDEYVVYARSTHLPYTFHPSDTNSQAKTLRTITDSGATHNMNPHRHTFDKIHPLHNTYGRTATVVLLGDGTTTRPVLGWGYARYMLNGIPVRKKELYVPSLGTLLTLVTQHCQYQGCYFHAENGQAILAFPENVLQAGQLPR